jgi:hypothetical protein
MPILASAHSLFCVGSVSVNDIAIHLVAQTQTSDLYWIFFALSLPNVKFISKSCHLYFPNILKLANHSPLPLFPSSQSPHNLLTYFLHPVLLPMVSSLCSSQSGPFTTQQFTSVMWSKPKFCKDFPSNPEHPKLYYSLQAQYLSDSLPASLSWVPQLNTVR